MNRYFRTHSSKTNNYRIQFVGKIKKMCTTSLMFALNNTNRKIISTFQLWNIFSHLHTNYVLYSDFCTIVILQKIKIKRYTIVYSFGSGACPAHICFVIRAILADKYFRVFGRGQSRERLPHRKTRDGRDTWPGHIQLFI